MKLCRFEAGTGKARIGLLEGNDTIIDLSAGGVDTISSLLEKADPVAELHKVPRNDLPRINLRSARLLPPVEQQEVWAVGVTYLRSKKARMEESDFSATAYDRVYDADRPELFFKAMPYKVVGHGGWPS